VHHFYSPRINKTGNLLLRVKKNKSYWNRVNSSARVIKLSAKTLNGNPDKYGWCVKVSQKGKNYIAYTNKYILNNLLSK
jgi:hypothetical protein